MQEISNSWEGWKSQLADAVRIGESMNLSPEQMANKAEQIGDFLARRIDPKNPEQKVLQELWQAASDEEQRTLASILINLVSSTRTH